MDSTPESRSEEREKRQEHREERHEAREILSTREAEELKFKRIGRPELLSRIIYPTNWRYLIVNLSTTTQAQNTFLNNANTKKCYYKTKCWSLKPDGTKSETILRDYPSDLWTVGISSQ